MFGEGCGGVRVGVQGRGGLGAVTDLKCQPIRVKRRSREMRSRCWVSSPSLAGYSIAHERTSRWSAQRRSWSTWVSDDPTTNRSISTSFRVDRVRWVRSLVWIDSDHHLCHDQLLGVVGMECEVVAGTPDRRRRALASFEPHHDQNNQPTRHLQGTTTRRRQARAEPTDQPLATPETSTATRYGAIRHK